MRARSIRLATSDVMKTVLPARARPVTPKRIVVSVKGLANVLATFSTPRVRLSARLPITKMLSFQLVSNPKIRARMGSCQRGQRLARSHAIR